MKLSISLIERYIVVLAALVGLLAVFGCSGDDTPTNGGPPNQDPVVEFTVTVRAVPRSEAQTERYATLTVDATDPDGDPVTVTWAVTRDGQPSGSLTTSQGPSVRWRTPYETGRDTITVAVSDGRGGSATLIETIQTGTLKDTRIQTGTQTWNAVDSPFIIRPFEDNFVIDERSTLVVEAGSELLIDRAGLTFSVVGALDINGTAEAPVIIRPNARISEPGDWEGIFGSPSGTTPVIGLVHTQIQYATAAVKAVGAAEIYLDECRITRSSEAAVWHGSSGPLQVMNTEISSNDNSGIRIIKISTPLPTVTISGCTITSNGDLTGETFYVDQAGIYISIPDPGGSAAISVENCETNFNGVPGVQLGNACYPLFRQNGIYANEMGKSGTRYNLKLEDGFGGTIDTIDAAQNFWGVFTEAEIKATIRDSEDNGSIGVRVVVDPWLTEAP